VQQFFQEHLCSALFRALHQVRSPGGARILVAMARSANRAAVLYDGGLVVPVIGHVRRAVVPVVVRTQGVWCG
jgi:hypothetical protein